MGSASGWWRAYRLSLDIGAVQKGFNNEEAWERSRQTVGEEEGKNVCGVREEEGERVWECKFEKC